MSPKESENTTKSGELTDHPPPAAKAATFAELGLMPELCEACLRLGYKEPTEIQRLAVPATLRGDDVVALAQTGSGKTAAFALPILQALWNDPKPLFACVLAPTRELAIQIQEAFQALGSGIGVRAVAIVGGMDHVKQALALARNPHIVVATPGRLEEHLRETRGFSLRDVRYLVLDEADRLLDSDFSTIIERILRCLPAAAGSTRLPTGGAPTGAGRRTLLFSATMTDKVAKLQRACMSRTPTRVSASASRYDTVETLLQYYKFIPLKHKDVYLAYLLNDIAAGHLVIVFAATIQSVQRLVLMLRALGFAAVPIHGKMPQPSRLGALAKFKSGARTIMIATDVIARGLDIPLVDVVINYDVPANSKNYIHRVGRTARAGRSGKAITLVTQYDLEAYLQIETLLQKKLPELPADKDMVMLLAERVCEATAVAATQLRELESAGSKHDAHGSKKRKRGDPAAEDADLDADGETAVSQGVTSKYKHLKSRKRNKASFKF